MRSLASDNNFLYLVHAGVNGTGFNFYKAEWFNTQYGFPLDEISGRLTSYYESCHASIPKVPHLPTPGDIAALTSDQSWGSNSVKLFSDPKYGTTPFMTCMNEFFTAWEKAMDKSNNQAFLVGVGIVLGVCVLGGLGFLAYNQASKRGYCAESLWSKLTRSCSGIRFLGGSGRHSINGVNDEEATLHSISDDDEEEESIPLLDRRSNGHYGASNAF